MQKPFALIIIFLCPFIVFAGGFVLKGNIEGLPTGAATLTYTNESGDDTTLITSITGGKFTFKGNVPEPELATVVITGGGGYDFKFFLENTAITIRLVKSASEKTTVTGSVSNTVYEKLKPGLVEFFTNARESNNRHMATDSLWISQQHQWMQNIRQNITPGPQSYAALYFIGWLLFKPGNMDSIFLLFKQLSPAAQNGLAGRKFMTGFEHLHKISPGSPAPEITGHDTSGQPVKLAKYLGKVVLLDFWASYCGPCRQENKRMLAVYQKYHGAGFEIVSLSLDNERSMWVRAIQADGLPWPQVSELRGGAGATSAIYDISDLPRNVLIDGTGKIFAKDLHGEELIKAVETLLNKK